MDFDKTNPHGDQDDKFGYMCCSCGLKHIKHNFTCPMTVYKYISVEKERKDLWIQGKTKIEGIPASRCSKTMKNKDYKLLPYFRQPKKFFNVKNKDGTQQYYLTRNRRSYDKIANVFSFWQKHAGIAKGKKVTGKSGRTTVAKNVIHDIGSENFTEKQKSEFLHHSSVKQTYEYAGAATDHASRANISRLALKKIIFGAL